MDKRLARKFGVVLRQLRLGRKLSQEALAFEASLDRTFISMLERGTRQPTLETIFRLAKVLRVDPSSIVRRME
ncbi:MAG: helix-turn-helix transcriptional regulator [Candidatus Aenigmarchaeota archaeon]|nr:helix-turn-helix transcriptional regulator [Candidatus Aenigmarchaeota archaeon]